MAPGEPASREPNCLELGNLMQEVGKTMRLPPLTSGHGTRAVLKVPKTKFFLVPPAKVEKRFEFIVRIQAQRARPVTPLVKKLKRVEIA